MLKKYIKSHHGFTLIELMIVLVITTISILYAGWESQESFRKSVATSAATQIKLIGEATQAFIANPSNAATINAAASMNITVAQLQLVTSCGTATPCLSNAVSPINPWKASYTILLRRIGVSTPYQYEFLVSTTGPKAAFIDGGLVRLGALGNGAAEVSKLVGFTTNLGVGGLRAVGNNGSWTVTTANYPSPSISTPGQMVYFYTTVGNPFDSVYLRVDGGNAATGNINLGGNGIYGVAKGVNDPLVIAASSGSTGGKSNLYMNGDVNLTSTTGDIKLAGLSNGAVVNGGTAYGTQSVLSLLPKLVEVGTSTVGHGTIVPAITCQSGGTQNIFVIPSSEITQVYNGNTGYTFKAFGSGPWTISILGPDNLTPVVGSNIAIARTFCSY